MTSNWKRATAIGFLVPLTIAASLGLGVTPDEEEGFVPLFDGESLEGWVTTGGRYDGHASWTVEDGCIVGREGPGGAGGLLYTERPYTSFELVLETRIEHPFDSGVFLRMAPEGKGAQVTLDHRPGGEIGAIYSDGFLAHNEAGEESFRDGEWNELRVRCTGFDMHITCWLNGELLIEYELPPDSPGYAPNGLIGLQVHGAGGATGETGAVWFRNVRVKELPVFGEDLAAGWRPLFDGTSLDGWSVAGQDGRYVAQDGVLSFQTGGAGGHLFTNEDFRDFHLRLDFATAHMANSGVFLRAARDGSNPAYSGCEVQILDDFNWEEVTGTTLQPWQFTGGLYGAVPPGDRDALRQIGEWNTYEILYRGSRLAVALNGTTLYDVDTTALEAEPPFAERARTGFIGLQHHGSHDIEAETMVRFRNVQVLPLTGR